jgi:hypothetical protein
MARPLKILNKAQRRKVLRTVARRLEKFPALYRFLETRIPKRGECGCMLGHAGAIMRVTPNVFGEALDKTATKLGFDGDSAFYRAVERALRSLGLRDNITDNDGPRVAKGLRQLAASI